MFLPIYSSLFSCVFFLLSPSLPPSLTPSPLHLRWFLYLNDDVMFGDDIWPHDFFTPEGGQRVSHTIPISFK